MTNKPLVNIMGLPTEMELMKLASKRKKSVTKAMNKKVDEYLTLHKEMSEIKRKMDALRKDIEPFMQDNDIKVIESTNPALGRLEIVDTKRAIMNARYTSYDKEGIMSLVSPDIVKECVVEVVDRDVLEFLVKQGKAPKEVEDFKILNEGTNFSVKR